jgi:DNA-directed RNA polymerase specialized sigma24 family protein
MGPTSSVTPVQSQDRAVGVRLRSLVLELTADSGEVTRMQDTLVEVAGAIRHILAAWLGNPDVGDDAIQSACTRLFGRSWRRSKPRWPA